MPMLVIELYNGKKIYVPQDEGTHVYLDFGVDRVKVRDANDVFLTTVHRYEITEIYTSDTSNLFEAGVSHIKTDSNGRKAEVFFYEGTFIP